MRSSLIKAPTDLWRGWNLDPLQLIQAKEFQNASRRPSSRFPWSLPLRPVQPNFPGAERYSRPGLAKEIELPTIDEMRKCAEKKPDKPKPPPKPPQQYDVPKVARLPKSHMTTVKQYNKKVVKQKAKLKDRPIVANAAAVAPAMAVAYQQIFSGLSLARQLGVELKSHGNRQVMEELTFEDMQKMIAKQVKLAETAGEQGDGVMEVIDQMLPMVAPSHTSQTLKLLHQKQIEHSMKLFQGSVLFGKAGAVNPDKNNAWDNGVVEMHNLAIDGGMLDGEKLAAVEPPPGSAGSPSASDEASQNSSQRSVND